MLRFLNYKLFCFFFLFLQPSSALSVVEMDALWPQLNEFQLLGLFNLNNAFALYLITYSINFLVIIFEFEYNRAHQ